MRVRYTRRARNDLVAILDYLDERSPQGARNVKHAIRQTVDFIGQFPESGRRSNLEETRVFQVGRYPYMIYWRIEAGEVRILHIRHAARRPWTGGD
jgi:plasmid stabilization system protein ParE